LIYHFHILMDTMYETELLLTNGLIGIFVLGNNKT
jgi:hypothetical protein